jgi:hypothetical protein
MNRPLIATLLGFVGIVCMLAANYDILADNIALFIGSIAFIAAGLAWWVPVNRRERE